MEQEDRITARHVGPGEGRTVRTPWAELVARKVAAAQTGGAYSLFEVAVQPGGGPPPHVRHREDECFYVLEGRFGFVTEGGPIEAGPGSLVYFPKGDLRTFENVGAREGRLLVIGTPGGTHERFLEETGAPVKGETAPSASEQPPDTEGFVAIAADCGVEVVPPLKSTGARDRSKTERRSERSLVHDQATFWGTERCSWCGQPNTLHTLSASS